MSSLLQTSNERPGSSGTAVLNAPNSNILQTPGQLEGSTDISDIGPNMAEDEATEQPLESHEVIELQSFSERKAWIDQKIEASHSSQVR
jgi:hypothetical protein